MRMHRQLTFPYDCRCAQALKGLSDDDLKELGVVKMGPRSKLKQRVHPSVNALTFGSLPL